MIKALGYTEDDVPEAVLESIENIYSNAINSAEIKCAYKIFSNDEIKISKSKLNINHFEFDIKNIIGLHLRNADSIAIFAATLGNKFDELIALSKEKDLLDAFIIDTLGSELIEMVGDWLELQIQENIGNKNISNRLSPGYCGWSVSEQQKIFALLGNNCCGISISDSSLMNPIKSISGIIGIGEKLVRQDYQCKICSLENCYKRKRVEVSNG